MDKILSLQKDILQDNRLNSELRKDKGTCTSYYKDNAC